MSQLEIERHLDALYNDFDNVMNMDEETACKRYNVDSKSEILEVIQDEIDVCKSRLQPEEDDGGMDYDALCKVLGLSRYA